MSFFQNVFTNEFLLPIAVGDRQYAPTFKLPPNTGRGPESVLAWEQAPYNLSGNDGDGNAKSNLRIAFAIDPEFKNWSYFNVDVTAGAVSSSAVTSAEVVTALNANVTFFERFEASLSSTPGTSSQRVIIKQRQPLDRLRFYIVNGRAESVIRFNARAGVAELPSFFERHTIDNRFNENSLGLLILLDDTSSVVDQNVIDNAVNAKGVSLGYAYGSVQEDWELLKGSSVNFTFKKQTIDGSNRLTQTIEYPAGAVAGDFARKTIYTYTAAQTVPTTIAEIPYVLTGSDLITP